VHSLLTAGGDLLYPLRPMIFAAASRSVAGKRKGPCVYLLAGLLFLCLACLEIPEMSTLTDDVSNDFTILRHGSDSAEVIARAKKVEQAREQPAAVRQIEFATEPATRPATRPGSRDLLALHSLRRT
jgi:hypothetical protein